MKGRDRTHQETSDSNGGSARQTPRMSSIVKKICLGFLVITVIGVSVINSILTFRATYYYAAIGFPWYEWMNYLFLGLFLLICPILSLFFLDSVHVRRLLRIWCFGMALNNALEVFEGPIGHLGVIFDYQRPFNAIYLLVEFAALVICWIFLLRQIRGRSLLPIPVRTDRRRFGSTLRNLKNFMITPPENRKKFTNTVILINVVCFAGVFITLPVEGKTITLERPEGHEMAIKFWANEPDDYSEATLQILADNNIEMYGWVSKQEAKAYADHNITVKVQRSIPSGDDAAELADFYNEIDSWMDFADSDENMSEYFKGFIADDEGLRTIAKINQTHYDDEINTKVQVIDYINSRGYNYSYCTLMSNIGDLYDGDIDMDLVYGNPFDPIQYENISALNWMVYRSEMAMQYDEPYEYFTYQWAKYIADYMHYIEDTNGFGRGYWLNRTGMSIGVAADQMYTYNTDLRNSDVALEELIRDAKICHACEIGEIAIFYFPFFIEQWGSAGLQQLIDEVNSYTSVSFKYHRRATYFGNLKWASNSNGSVFGLLFCDGLYEEWVGYLGLIWLVLLLVLPWLFLSSKIGIKDESEQGFGKGGKSLEDHNTLKRADTGTIILRTSLFGLAALVFIWVFLVANIFVFTPEFVIWVPWYWQDVALDDESFSAFWDDFTTEYVYYVLAALTFMAIMPIAFGKIFDRIDKKRKTTA